MPPKRCVSPGAVGPASRLRRRFADAPSATLLTGLDAAEFAQAREMAAAAVIPRPSTQWPMSEGLSIRFGPDRTADGAALSVLGRSTKAPSTDQSCEVSNQDMALQQTRP